MFLTVIFCSLLDFTNWLQNHLLSCPFKKLTGIDCPGCGFQRSMVALLKGNLGASIQLYPASIPIFLTAGFVYVTYKCNIDDNHRIKKALYIVTGTIIIGFYIYKLYHLYT